MARVSLVEGGKTVNGKFVPTGSSSSTGTSTGTSGGTSMKTTSGGTTSTPDLTTQLSNVLQQAKSLGLATPEVARGQAMLAQTKAEGAKPFAGSAFEKAITPESMRGLPTPQLPTGIQPPSITGAALETGTAALGTIPGGTLTYDTTTKTLVPRVTTEDALANLMATYQQPIDYGRIERQAYKGAGVEQARANVNALAAQLNTIIKGAEASQLGLIGQGRGIPETIIGGQQAQIQREAAIKALPVQAALAAAQGDLQMAQDRYNMLFKVQSEMATNEYNAKVNAANALYQFADKQEARQLAEYTKQQDRSYAEKQGNISVAFKAVQQATENGQATLANRIAALDPASPTFMQDLTRLSTQVVAPVTTGAAAGIKAPEVKNFGTADNPDWRVWDMARQQFVSAPGVGGAGPAGALPPQKQQQLQETLSLATELRGTVPGTNMPEVNVPGKKAAIGASFQKLIPFGVSLGFQPDRAAFEAKLNTLKSYLTLDNIKLLKGAMSDKDLAFLQSIGSSLSTDMSESAFNSELDRIINKLNTSLGNQPSAQTQQPKEGDTYTYQGVTYRVINNQWVPQ